MQTLGLSQSTPKPTNRFKELFWPSITDDVSAVTAARNGMFACFFIAGMTAVLAAMQQQWAAIFDGALFAIAGLGVRQLSRMASVTALALYIGSQIAGLLMGVSRPGVVTVIVTAILTGAVRAAFLARRLTRGEPETIANPEMAGETAVERALEVAPKRIWPRVRIPFLLFLGLLAQIQVIVWIGLIFLRAFVIPNASMEPTLMPGDKAMALRQRFAGAPRRGDVIAFRNPANPRDTFTKRVIGVPGDRILIVEKRLFLNGKEVQEPYAENRTDYLDVYRDGFPAFPPPDQFLTEQARAMLAAHVRNGELVVPPRQYFVLGDNRDFSLDSRYIGLVHEELLEGRMVFVYSAAAGRDAHWIERFPLAPPPAGSAQPVETGRLR